MFMALQSLDGYEQIVKVNGEDRLIRSAYDFNGKVRYNLAKNIKLLRSHIETFDDVQNALVKELAPETNEISREKDPVAYGSYINKLNEALEAEEDIEGLHKIKFEDLNLDKKDKNDKPVNPIPGTTIAALLHIIED